MDARQTRSAEKEREREAKNEELETIYDDERKNE